MDLFKRLSLLFLLVCAGLHAQVDGQPATKRPLFFSDNKKQTALDSLVDETVFKFMQSPQNCGLSIGISKNGSNYFYNYGETSRHSKNTPTQTTIYEIGSVTATFCGILLAKAITENKVKPDDDIRKYLQGKYPTLISGKTPIRLVHLANHTSGLPAVPENMKFQPDFDSLNPYRNYDKKKVYAYLATVQLNHVPGTVCDYSNLGIALLGIILETVYNKPFDELVKEKICLPADMNNTSVHLSEQQQAQFAEGYNESCLATPHWDLGDLSAAGGIHSSANDLLNYLNYNLSEKDTAVKLAHQPTFSNRQTLGMGWFIKKTKQGNTLTWHNGATYGFSSFCGFIKEKKCSFVILANSSTNTDYIGIAILNYLQQ